MVRSYPQRPKDAWSSGDLDGRRRFGSMQCNAEPYVSVESSVADVYS
jgi:hypothetical protein